jgi:aquaporin Z
VQKFQPFQGRFFFLFLQLIARSEITTPRTAMHLLSAQPAPATDAEATDSAQFLRPLLSPGRALRLHWPEYLMEAGGLGFFMISACLFGALYENPASPVRQAVTSTLLRRLLMGISMGLTSMAIVYSPWGKQSGAHINPSVTLTFFRLGKIPKWDAIFYALAQFTGAVLGVALVAIFFGKAVSHPAVRYVVTVPGENGIPVALLAEFVIAFVLMSVILHASNHHRFSRLTGLFAAALVATYITLEAPFSGMSMNPARTLGSAFSAEIFSGLWIYFTAPPLGMLCAAELYLWWKGKFAVKCCKLHHDSLKRCIFCGANGGFAS